MYETLIMIDPGSSISDDSIEDALHKVYGASADSEPVIQRQGSSFKIAWPSFTFQFDRSQLPHVLEESEEIARSFAEGRPEQSRIALCSSRVEIVGDDDPDMDYFNDYCLIVGRIEKLGSVYTFDQGSAEFMNL